MAAAARVDGGRRAAGRFLVLVAQTGRRFVGVDHDCQRRLKSNPASAAFYEALGYGDRAIVFQKYLTD